MKQRLRRWKQDWKMFFKAAWDIWAWEPFRIAVAPLLVAAICVGVMYATCGRVISQIKASEEKEIARQTQIVRDPDAEFDVLAQKFDWVVERADEKCRIKMRNERSYEQTIAGHLLHPFAIPVPNDVPDSAEVTITVNAGELRAASRYYQEANALEVERIVKEK